MIYGRVDENGRASFGLANNDVAVDTNCAEALHGVHALTLPVSNSAVKTAADRGFLQPSANYFWSYPKWVM
jgi:hypothetical protein